MLIIPNMDCSHFCFPRYGIHGQTRSKDIPPLSPLLLSSLFSTCKLQQFRSINSSDNRVVACQKGSFSVNMKTVKTKF